MEACTIEVGVVVEAVVEEVVDVTNIAVETLVEEVIEVVVVEEADEEEGSE